SKSTQLRAFDDLEYQFNREFAALGRIGYENLRFPLQPAATTTGIIWLVGGQWTPLPGSYFVFHYGRLDGFYGFDGILRYQATPNTAILGSFQRNLSSSQGNLLNNLNASQLDSNGILV